MVTDQVGRQGDKPMCRGPVPASASSAFSAANAVLRPLRLCGESLSQRGPAVRTASSTPAAYFSKLSLNIFASFAACAS